ncbi:MAG: CNNM domain-containing protein [candidate division WOR-3 bacterium]
MEILLGILAILGQSVFTLSETALIRLDRFRLKEQSASGLQWAGTVLYFLDHPEEFFTIILVCEDLALVAASILFEKFFVETLGSHYTIVAIVSLSLLSLIVGQYLPKAIGLLMPERAMALLAHPLMLLRNVLRPILAPFSFLPRLIYKQSSGVGFSLHRRDLVTALNEIERSASRILARLFALRETLVNDLMIPIDKVFSLPHTITIDQIREKGLIKKPYTRIPVYQDNPSNIVHVINLKDIIFHNKISMRPIATVKSKTQAMPIFKKMKNEGEHMAVVIDQNGKAIGIITLEDMIEELIGEIRDEP